MKDFFKQLQYEFWTIIYIMVLVMPITACISFYNKDYALAAIPYVTCPITLIIWYKRGGSEGYKRSL